MQFAKRLLMILGSFVLLVSLMSLAAPKAAHALVATLVQVANTTANPAVTLDAGKSTRIPYQSMTLDTVCEASAFCDFTSFTAVPAGYRLVVQGVTGNVNLSSGTVQPTGTLRIIHNDVGSFPNAYFVGNNIQSAALSVGYYNQPVTEFVDAGDAPEVSFAGDIAFGTQATAIINGYLENCSVTGCPPVQH